MSQDYSQDRRNECCYEHFTSFNGLYIKTVIVPIGNNFLIKSFRHCSIVRQNYKQNNIFLNRKHCNKKQLHISYQIVHNILKMVFNENFFKVFFFSKYCMPYIKGMSATSEI